MSSEIETLQELADKFSQHPAEPKAVAALNAAIAALTPPSSATPGERVPAWVDALAEKWACCVAADHFYGHVFKQVAQEMLDAAYGRKGPPYSFVYGIGRSTPQPQERAGSEAGAVACYRAHWPGGEQGSWNDGAPSPDTLAMAEKCGLRIEYAYTRPQPASDALNQAINDALRDGKGVMRIDPASMYQPASDATSSATPGEVLAKAIYDPNSERAATVERFDWPNSAGFVNVWIVRAIEHTTQAQPQERCDRCDDTGEVHRADGEYLGECDCQPQERAGSDAGVDDPHEFGAGIMPNPKARYWQERARFWREHAIALGYTPEDTRPQPASDASGGRNFRDETLADARAQLVNVLKAQKSWVTGYAEAYVDEFVEMSLSRALAESRAEQSAMFLRAREWAERYGAAERSLAEAVAMANRIVNFSDLEMQDGDAAREVCAAFVAAQQQEGNRD